jgi:hypothetical protein
MEARVVTVDVRVKVAVLKKGLLTVLLSYNQYCPGASLDNLELLQLLAAAIVPLFVAD